MNEKLIARTLAQVLAAGRGDPEALAERARLALRRCPKWVLGLAHRVAERFASEWRVPESRLEAFIEADPAFLRHGEKLRLRFREFCRARPEMCPAAGAPRRWSLPALTTAGELADWLGVTTPQLDWLADCKGLERTTREGALCNYNYTWIKKPSGSRRLIEAPKARLKALQRRVLTDILDRIPPHEAVHGFRRGRCVLSYATPHVGQHVVLRMDLAHFFPGIRRARVMGLFLAGGYPEGVARLLTGLCTNTVPTWVFEASRALRPGSHEDVLQRLYLQPHLPQGAPTSPALANLCAFRLDCRLAALARSVGATYTRYADDLAFSGGDGLARAAKRFHVHVAAIALEEGFAVHTRKTRIMRQGVRQQLAGVVVNERPNVCRRDYDALKATLFNCTRYEPDSQNIEGVLDFRAHLAGRIAYVTHVNPQRGERLRKLFERIPW